MPSQTEVTATQTISRLDVMGWFPGGVKYRATNATNKIGKQSYTCQTWNVIE